ncbi:SufD family Fe-S cluster assembly protein [Candidatus Dojkabacteria bacterium]|nr:SufD family Fe-S cluster assembly protein [Candidatus Dojkabacteria bacterium]
MNTVWFDITKNEIEVTEDKLQYVYLFVGKKGDSIKSHINFIHRNPNITSNILIKAILFDNAKFDVFANLIIEKGAKEVDSYLKIEVLLMSERASATAIPSLEITESSVKGGHGATIGPVDEEQLFYLQSRGINKDNAEKVLAEGFTQSIVDKFGESELPHELKAELSKLSLSDI